MHKCMEVRGACALNIDTYLTIRNASTRRRIVSRRRERRDDAAHVSLHLRASPFSFMKRGADYRFHSPPPLPADRSGRCDNSRSKRERFATPPFWKSSPSREHLSLSLSLFLSRSTTSRRIVVLLIPRIRIRTARRVVDPTDRRAAAEADSTSMPLNPMSLSDAREWNLLIPVIVYARARAQVETPFSFSPCKSCTFFPFERSDVACLSAFLLFSDPRNLHCARGTALP